MPDSSQTAKLTVTMFGGFSIYYNASLVLSDNGRSRKIWSLLEYLIANRNKNISQDEFIDYLSKEQEYDNPLNALKNLIYRLRTFLTSNGLPEFDYIVTKHGSYSWNPAMDCSIDIEEFEAAWKSASSPNLDISQKLALYLQAIDLYKGKFLPGCSFEEWAVSLTRYYHSIYIECINSAYELYCKIGNYEPIVSVCNYALAIDPYDEHIYEMLIYALVKLNKHQEAMNAYHQITDLLFNELGVNPSEKLRNMYRQITNTINSVENDLLVIKEGLREATCEKGAYYCDYEIFKNIYRIVARSLERSGASVFLVLYSVTLRKGSVPEPALLAAAMEELRSSIGNSLRRGDVFARFSSSQYVVMLQGVSFETGGMVAQRIANAFSNITLKRKNIVLSYKMQPVDPNAGTE